MKYKESFKNSILRVPTARFFSIDRKNSLIKMDKRFVDGHL